MQAAHKAVFENLCEHVNTSIISGGNVERMSMLRERYLTSILHNNPTAIILIVKLINL